MTLPVPVVGHASELTFGDGDVVIVAVKSQDTAACSTRLPASPRRRRRSSASRTGSPTR